MTIYEYHVISAVVNIGFHSLESVTTENISASVCAQLLIGSLERNMTTYLSTVLGGTAESK